MNQSQDRVVTNAEALGPEHTRRQLLRGLAGGAIGAGLLTSLRVGASGQEATPQSAASAAPSLEWICTITVQLGEPTVVGDTPHGTRLILPLGGVVEGPALTGRLIPITADWMLVRPDGVGELDVRATLQTQDDALLYVTNRGYVTNVPQWLPRWSQGEEIPPEEYYFAATPWFETSAAQYDWLQQTIVISAGTLIPGGLRQELFAVR